MCRGGGAFGYDGRMRRWVIITLIAVTVFVTVDFIRHLNDVPHTDFHYIGISMVICTWCVFWIFDRVRALEQRRRDQKPQKYSVQVVEQDPDKINTTSIYETVTLAAPPVSLKQFLRAIRGSLILAFALIFFDAILDGTLLFSYLICPIWFVVALIRASFSRESTRVITARILAPVLVGLLVFGNYMFQWNIARAHAAQIIQACERYREVNGTYPRKLDDLVPRYLSSIPIAKYCLGQNQFTYYNSGSPAPILWWLQIPPFGNEIYNFQRRTWRYLD
jgi:hypothetical protein